LLVLRRWPRLIEGYHGKVDEIGRIFGYDKSSKINTLSFDLKGCAIVDCAGFEGAVRSEEP
jgi:hypothetical protein